MASIKEILTSKLKPKEKQTTLVEAICTKQISGEEFINYFLAASDVDKGNCADVMKHVSEHSAEILEPYIDILIPYINYKTPRVKWGIPEAMENLAKNYPEKVVAAIPKLIENTVEN